MNRQNLIITVCTVIGAVLLILISRPISEFVVGLFFKPVSMKQHGIALGSIDASTGTIWLKPKGKIDFQKVSPPQNIYHHDQIKVDSTSSAQIIFNNGWSLLFKQNTRFVIEQYRPGIDDSPLLISIAQGTYQLLDKGMQGLLFVTQNQKIFTPERPPLPAQRQITIGSKNQKNNKKMNAASSASEAFTADGRLEELSPLTTDLSAQQLSAKVPGPLPTKINHDDKKTLANEYIERIFESQVGALRRCQLNSARDNKNIEGMLLLSITILPNGKTNDVKILRDTITNEQLEQCVLSVVNRTYFKAFSGLPISLTYPLQFQ